MAPVKNGRVIFKEIPAEKYIPGQTTVYDDSQTIDLENVPLEGGILVKTVVLSLDPFLRGLMRESSPGEHIPVFKLGQPIHGIGIVRVLRSETDAFKVGDHLYGMAAFQEYTVIKNPSQAGPGAARVITNDEGIPWSVLVGVGGMPGQTAHHGWKEYAKAKKGEVAFITTAAGPVGATVLQLAKRDGLKVIASVGSDEKVEYVKSLGADVAFNYKTTDTRAVLKKEGPIDVYWDNVGGDTLDAALENANQFGRFIECGMISQYEKGGKFDGIKNLFLTISKTVSIHGFVVNALFEKYAADFAQTFPKLIKSGEIKYKEDVTRGLEGAEQAFHDLFTGKNFGKAVIVLDDN